MLEISFLTLKGDCSLQITIFVTERLINPISNTEKSNNLCKMQIRK